MTKIYDNTELSTYRNCPRKYFFRHVLHLRGEAVSPPLIFGSSWHAAMDVVWTRFVGDQVASDKALDVAQEAYGAFEDKWKAEGGPSPYDPDPLVWEDWAPRTPDVAAEMIINYIKDRIHIFRRSALVAVEQPFAVPLDPNRPIFYAGRLDKVIQWENGSVVIEHKTSSAYKKDGYFKATFTDSFTPNSQIDGYSYASHMLYDNFRRVFVDAALVHRTVHWGFGLIPVERNPQHLDGWLWETVYTVERLEQDRTECESLQASGNFHILTYMPCFPKNTDTCFDYFTPCPYLNLCKSWGNPLRDFKAHGVPHGFVQDKWSPFDYIQLEKIGLKREDVDDTAE